MSLDAYPTYKETNVPMLGAIPSGWKQSKAGRSARFSMGQTILKEDLSQQGGWPVFSATEGDQYFGEIESPTVRLYPGDLVIPARGNSIGHVKLVTENATTTQTTIYCKINKRDELRPKYLYYFLIGLKKELFRFTQTAIPQITVAEVAANPVLLPPIKDQDAITTFLDRETVKIDALIDKQEQLIATLREDRTATITHAVTKGLDPNAAMKDSGVPWIGEVPADWTVGKVKHGFSVVLGKMYQGGRQDPGDTELPHLKAGSLLESGLNTDDPMRCWFSPAEVRSLSLKENDVLVVEGGAIGRCVVLDKDLPGWGFQKSLNRVRAKGSDSPQFLAYLIEAATTSGHVSVLCGRATIPHFTAEKLAALEWPHPSPEEQRRVVGYLDEKCVQIGRLVGKAQDVVAILREYRSALITDAVTGKIDVRGVA